MGKDFKSLVVPMTANAMAAFFAGIAGPFELVGSALLIIGLFSRPAAFHLAGVMTVGYFVTHTLRGSYPILHGGALRYLAAAGPGP